MVGEGSAVIFAAGDVVAIYGENIEVFVGVGGICGKACEGLSILWIGFELYVNIHPR